MAFLTCTRGTRRTRHNTRGGAGRPTSTRTSPFSMVPFAAAGPEGTNPLTTSDPLWGSSMLKAIPTPHCARRKSVHQCVPARSTCCSICGRDVARNSTDEGGITPGLDPPSCRQWFPFFPLRATAKNHAHQTPPPSSQLTRFVQRTRAHAALECAAHLQNLCPVNCSTQAPRTLPSRPRFRRFSTNCLSEKYIFPLWFIRVRSNNA